MFVMDLRQLNPRKQGDIGESVAACWLMQQGYGVWLPFGHSPDSDLLAEKERKLFRVQVKTSTSLKNDRWIVATCTRGGNRSWNKVIKRLEASRIDYLFVVVGDWRCWFIPAREVDGRSGISLGGPKYSEFEIRPPNPFSVLAPPSESAAVGEAGFEPA
jgi:Holliday junction resolvase-like predicted endonuclease